MLSNISNLQNAQIIIDYNQIRAMEQNIPNIQNNLKIDQLQWRIIFDQLSFANDQYQIQHYFEAFQLIKENNLYYRQKLFKKLKQQKKAYDKIWKEFNTIYVSNYREEYQNKFKLAQLISFINLVSLQINKNILNYRRHKLEIIKTQQIGLIDQSILDDMFYYLSLAMMTKIKSYQLFSKVQLNRSLIIEFEVMLQQVELLAESSIYYSMKHYKNALEICQNNSQENYDVLLVQGNLINDRKAKCLFKIRNYQNSINICNQLQKMTKNDPNVLYYKGKAYFNINDLDKSQKIFNEIIFINNQFYKVYQKLGQIFMSKKQFEKAIKQLDRSIESNNEIKSQIHNSKTYLFKGMALELLYQLKQAIEMYDHALLINPNNSYAYLCKGMAIQKFGQLDHANLMFDRFLKFDQNNAILYDQKGLLLMKQGKFSDAISMFDRALMIDPNNTRILHNRGRSLEWLGDLKNAITQYDHVLEIDPNHIESYNDKGDEPYIFFSALLLLHQGKYNEAIMICDHVFMIEPNNYVAFNNKGLVLQHQGKFDDAIQMYGRALEVYPQHSIFLNKGVALQKLGKLNEAIKMFDYAITMDSNSYLSYQNKGVILEIQGKLNDAIEMYDKALSINPNNANAYISKGNSLTIMRKFNEAQEMYNRALEINPNIEIFPQKIPSCYLYAFQK